MSEDEQRMSNLEVTTTDLLKSKGEMLQRVSEFEGKVNGRPFTNSILSSPQTHAAAIVILTVGMLMGMWSSAWNIGGYINGDSQVQAVTGFDTAASWLGTTRVPGMSRAETGTNEPIRRTRLEAILRCR